MGKPRGINDPVISNLSPRKTEFQERKPTSHVVCHKTLLGCNPGTTNRREKSPLIVLGKTFRAVITKTRLGKIFILKPVSSTHGHTHIPVRNTVQYGFRIRVRRLLHVKHGSQTGLMFTPRCHMQSPHLVTHLRRL